MLTKYSFDHLSLTYCRILENCPPSSSNSSNVSAANIISSLADFDILSVSYSDLSIKIGKLGHLGLYIFFIFLVSWTNNKQYLNRIKLNY